MYKTVFKKTLRPYVNKNKKRVKGLLITKIFFLELFEHSSVSSLDKVNQ